MLTINVMQGHDLKVGFSKAAPVAPFFYYQFHTFDEKYSEAAKGNNPVFNSKENFAVKFDEAMLRYLETQTLDVAFFDDNAPVSGMPSGAQSLSPAGQEVDDLIGICKVPLADLANGIGINKDFKVCDLNGAEVGKVTVQITVVDVSTNKEFNRLKTHKEITEFQKESYNDKWEEGIIRKIAAKLSKRIIDVELMFGIFSRGAKACTREDFKYCCLQRLDLGKELSDKELEMFLNQHPRLKDKATISQRDFIEIFSNEIIAARHEALNRDADDPALLLRYTQQMQETTARR